MVTIHATSNPEGAAIYINGTDTGKKTYASLQIARTKKPALIVMKLKGYDDFTFKDVDLDRGEITESATLVAKKATPIPHGNGNGSGKGSGAGKGSGKGSGGKQCDTCVERPD